MSLTCGERDAIQEYDSSSPMYEENGRRENGSPPMPAHWMPMSDVSKGVLIDVETGREYKSFQEILKLENSKDQGGTKSNP